VNFLGRSRVWPFCYVCVTQWCLLASNIHNQLFNRSIYSVAKSSRIISLIIALRFSNTHKDIIHIICVKESHEFVKRIKIDTGTLTVHQLYKRTMSYSRRFSDLSYANGARASTSALQVAFS
jgi:hypothetical protein